MKVKIIKSLKRFGGAALVAAMLLTTAAPAVLADEMNPETAQSEENITAENEILVVEDMDNAEVNSEETVEAEKLLADNMSASLSTVSTNGNGTTYVNNGGTIIINNGNKDSNSTGNNAAGTNGGSTGTGADKADENQQNTKKYTLVQWFTETTTNSEEANNIVNYYKKDGYTVNTKKTEVVKNQVNGLGGLIKIDIPFVTKKEYRYDISGEKRTEISAAQAKDYLEKFKGGKFEIVDENGSRVTGIAD